MFFQDNTVPPQTHIRRLLGGTIFGCNGFALSLLWRRISPHGTPSHDPAEASLASHSFFLLGSLAPLPIMDGGIILKWKLVEAGKSDAQADRLVHNTSLSLGGLLAGLGASDLDQIILQWFYQIGGQKRITVVRTESTRPSSWFSPFRYRKSIVLSAWFCVEAEKCSSKAS